MLYLLLSLLLFLFPHIVEAKFDPTSVPNNKYGIHIADPNDILESAILVNSSGGDWGYITVVIQQNDRNYEKWQHIFNQMRRLHIIPIVRIATEPVDDYWKIPKKEDALDWANFLNALNWPIENRYVVLFNEPNHANEWGKTIDPEAYAEIIVSYSAQLRKTSEDFFILPAGLDVSASSDGRSLDAETFFKRMLKAQPAFFDNVDGWTSHSYPNPGFSGSVWASGRGTIRSFQWEKELLTRYGINKKLPVFITETGWTHDEGITFDTAFLSASQIADNIKNAKMVWDDDSVIAVTPFVFNYQGYPFDHFSWRKLGTNEYYPHYFSYKELSKTRGKPPQRESYQFTEKIIPEVLVAGSNELLIQSLKNSGQGIITSSEDFQFEIKSSLPFPITTVGFTAIEPNQLGEISLYMETPDVSGTYEYELILHHDAKKISMESGSFMLVPPPSATIFAQLGLHSQSNAEKITVLIYDEHVLLAAYHDRKLVNGFVMLEGLRNIVPGQQYRVVILVPYYLPRQAIVTLEKETTNITMKRMLPLDLDLDGAFTMRDIRFFFSTPPKEFISRIL